MVVRRGSALGLRSSLGLVCGTCLAWSTYGYAGEPPQNVISADHSASASMSTEKTTSTSITPSKPVEIDEISLTAAQNLPEMNLPAPSFRPTYRGAAARNENTFFQFQLGNYAGDNVGINNGYMSLESRGGLFSDFGNTLFFGDARLLINDYEHAGANLGVGFRRYLADQGLIFGSNFYYDNWDSGLFNFNQLGAGVELLGDNWEVRSNAYAPIGTRNQQVGPSIGTVFGNNIFATRTYQTSLAGMDLEYGHTFWTGDSAQLKGFGGTYYYSGSGVDDGLGVRARGELALGNFSTLSLSVQNDSIFNTTTMFGASFLFPGRNHNGNVSRNSVYNRMTDRVNRQQNVSVANRTELADTGYDAFFVFGPPTILGPGPVSALSTSGPAPGTQANPYTVTDLMADPNFGPGDVAFLIGGPEPLVGNILIDDFNQRVIGAFDSSSIGRTVLNDNTLLAVSGLGMPATLDGSLTFQTSGFASGLIIDTSTQDGLVIDGIQDGDRVSVSTVSILNSIGDKIRVQNSGGEFEFLAGEAAFAEIGGSTGNGFGIYNSSTDIEIDALTINNSGQYGLYADGFTGSLTASVGLGILNPNFGGVYLANSNAEINLETFGVSGGGHGLYLESFSGTFSALNRAGFSNQVITAISQPASAAGNTSHLHFGDLSISGPNGYAINLEEHQGTFTVDGHAEIIDPVSIGLFAHGGSTDYSFGSLEIGYTGKAAVFEGHSGTVTVQESLVLNNIGSIGIEARNGSTRFDLGSLSVENVNGYGVALDNNDGNFIVQGQGHFLGNRNGALLARQSSGDISFGGLDVTYLPMASVSSGISLDNHQGDFTVVGDAVLTNPGQWGFLAHNSTSDIRFGSLDVSGTTTQAVALNNAIGSFTVDGDVSLTNVGNFGFQNTGIGNTGIHMGSLTVSGARFVGVNSEQSAGDFIVDGAVDVTGGNFGVQIMNQSGDVQFGSLGVHDNRYLGAVFSGISGELAIDGPLVGTNIGQGWYIDTGIQISGVQGPVNIGSVDIAGNGVTGFSYFSNSGGLNIEGEFKEAGFGTALNANGNTGDVSIGSVDITGPNGYGYGLLVNNNNGDFRVLGDTTIATPGLDAININGVTGDVGFGNITTTGTRQYGAFVANVSGDVTIEGDVNVTGGQFGLALQNVTGDTTVENIIIDGPDYSGVSITNSGDFTVTGDTTISNTHQGVAVLNSNSNLEFGNLTITDATSSGLSIFNNTGNLTVNGDAVFNNTGASAILSQNSSGDMSFGTLDVVNNFAAGISLDNHHGDFTVLGLTNLDGAGGNGIQSTGGSSGDFNFDDLTVAWSWTNQIALSGHTGNFTVTGDTMLTGGGHGLLVQSNSDMDFNFNTLSVNGSWQSGVALIDHDGSFTVADHATFTNTGSYGLQVERGSGDLLFEDITVTGATVNGLTFFDHGRNFESTGVTTITSPGNDGLFLHSNTGTFEFAELNISNPGNNGISLVAFDGDLTINGGTVSGIGSNQQGIFKHDFGTGSVSLSNMLFTSTANDVFGMVTLEYREDGAIALNNNQIEFASGSTGTIGYRLGSYGPNPVDLSGTGNTTSNAVEATAFDGIPTNYNGQVEIDGTLVP